ncbi:MAG: hypothetical protein C0603_02580 [Denitrovibrio sp.]|nr:MAG: hypothetical protein C0603_02580 [Denitrovibrio sp.]
MRKFYFLLILTFILLVIYMFSGRPYYDLDSFVDLTPVDDIELLDLDFKKAESEEVKLATNYPTFTKGNDVGILIIHGFTGSPLEMQPLTDYLVEQGFSTYQVRVAGHGSKPENLNVTNYKDWYESARYGYFMLKRNCKKVFVMGESMGGLVALSVAGLNDVDGAILLSPCIKIRTFTANFTPFAHHFIKMLPKVEAGDWTKDLKHIYYDKWPVVGLYQLFKYTRYVSANIDKIKVPLLGFQFINDGVVSGRATAEFFAKAPSDDKTYVEFPDKRMRNHILVSEKNIYRDEMFTKIAEWLRDRS